MLDVSIYMCMHECCMFSKIKDLELPTCIYCMANVAGRQYPCQEIYGQHKIIK